jgi:RimJ/RimL family protein N-acetyltransferase
VEEEILQSEARFAAGGCGLWALRERGAQPVIGFAGLRYFWEPPDLELVYALLPSRWGRGLATEAARAVIAHAFDVQALPEVRAATDVPNAGSIAVLRRLGFEEWKRTEDGPAGTLRFRLGAERWRADRR